MLIASPRVLPRADSDPPSGQVLAAERVLVAIAAMAIGTALPMLGFSPDPQLNLDGGTPIKHEAIRTSWSVNTGSSIAQTINAGGYRFRRGRLRRRLCQQRSF